jgi:hypothetical protein
MQLLALQIYNKVKLNVGLQTATKTAEQQLIITESQDNDRNI